jgi:ketosteroid isomerase-like protein
MTQTATQTGKVVKEIYEKAKRGDHRAVRQLLHEHATWHPSKDGAWRPCETADEIVRTLLWRAGPANRMRPAETLELGRLIFIRLRGRRLERIGAGGFWAPKLFQVVEVQDGKIVRMQDYRKREDALAAVGITL